MNDLAYFLLQTRSTPTQRSTSHGLLMIPIIIVVAIAIILIPYWFICKKAGFSPWLTLLNIVLRLAGWC